jgi:hypothetical protein
MVISPVIEESQRIRGWCEANQIDLSNLDFKLARSEEILPRLRARREIHSCQLCAQHAHGSANIRRQTQRVIVAETAHVLFGETTAELRANAITSSRCSVPH